MSTQKRDREAANHFEAAISDYPLVTEYYLNLTRARTSFAADRARYDFLVACVALGAAVMDKGTVDREEGTVEEEEEKEGTLDLAGAVNKFGSNEESFNNGLQGVENHIASERQISTVSSISSGRKDSEDAKQERLKTRQRKSFKNVSSDSSSKGYASASTGGSANSKIGGRKMFRVGVSDDNGDGVGVGDGINRKYGTNQSRPFQGRKNSQPTTSKSYSADQAKRSNVTAARKRHSIQSNYLATNQRNGSGGKNIAENDLEAITRRESDETGPSRNAGPTNYDSAKQTSGLDRKAVSALIPLAFLLFPGKSLDDILSIGGLKRIERELKEAVAKLEQVAKPPVKQRDEREKSELASRAMEGPMADKVVKCGVVLKALSDRSGHLGDTSTHPVDASGHPGGTKETTSSDSEDKSGVQEGLDSLLESQRQWTAENKGKGTSFCTYFLKHRYIQSDSLALL